MTVARDPFGAASGTSRPPSTPAEDATWAQDGPSHRRILVATDFTATSAAATDQAIALAVELRATLVAVSVIDPRRLRLGGRPARVDQLRAAREALVARLIEIARGRGVRVEYLIWVGEPSEAILEAANSEQAALIVIGSHGRSGVGRFLIGSVSDDVVRHSPIPVLVVRGSAVTSAAR
jgi:nucleotide-binding universal stress UspA family protein